MNRGCADIAQPSFQVCYMKKENKAILEMLLCASLWSIAGIFMKLLPWSGLAVAGLRSLVAGLTFAVYMAIRRIRFRFDRHTLIAGVLTGSVYLCFACANKLTTAANAIVLQAVKDYRDALKRLKKKPGNQAAMSDAMECERFFRSGWYKALTSVDGEYLIQKLREEAKSL